MKKLSILLCSMLLVSGVFAQWPANIGPDPYGYTMRNFDSSDFEYNWIDITTTGTQVTGLGDDNFVGPYDLGFNFQFYWLGRNEVYIGSNGFVSFNTGFNYASQGGGFATIPNNADQKNEMIAPLLSDLSFATPVAAFPNPAECYFFTNGTDLAIISFLNVPFWSSTDPGEWAGSNSFQIQLNGVDSTIKIIYLQQDGTYDAAYNPAANTAGLDPAPVVVGIENVSGTIGLGVNDAVLANDLLPLTGTGSIYSPPLTPGISIGDVEVFEIQNPESGGFFLPVPGQDFFVGAQLVNVGNVDIKSVTSVDAEINDAGTLLYSDNLTVDTIDVGASQPIQFGQPLVLAIAGSYEFNVDVTNVDDINFSNNSKTVEVNALDTTGGKATFGYTTFPDRTGVDASVLWTGGNGNSGAGVYIEPYGYPTTFEAAEFFLFPSVFLDAAGNPTINADTIPDGDYRVTVHQSDPSGAIPGSLLLLDTVITKANVDIAGPPNAAGNILLGDWNRVTFNTPFRVDSGGLYVAWYHFNDSLLLGGESTPPISRRAFEILSSTWAPHRSRNDQDYGIRLIGDVSEIVNKLPDAIEEELSDIEVFNAYPNPTEGVVSIEVNLEKATTATVRVLNMNGSKVHLSFHRGVSEINETIDLRKFAKGMYLIQVETALGVMTKKVAVQ